MTNKIDIEDIIQQIAKVHHISVNKDDPILILHTLNNLLLEHAAATQTEQLQLFNETLQLRLKQFSEESSKTAEKLITAGLNTSRRNIDAATNEQLEKLQAVTDRAVADIANTIQSETSRLVKASKSAFYASILAFASVVIMIVIAII
ncbi:hypothetical protein J3L11_14565 [Shewanella sp. 4t3-1-2LB]|uniref:hypothetical protein n=1 Tax=Shewanella sp. 4t3-1-2LB TaxID=2817682 RepID=UPI001A98E917|nr:hypothetical protein [Shewanella sp. 4t3-1-2LB]MBO1272867.1 hypothetical protein [Shewanella sp. 4t3-1-2LB]